MVENKQEVNKAALAPEKAEAPMAKPEGGGKVKVKLLKGLVGDDNNMYSAGAVIEVHEKKADFLLGMGDAEKAKADDKITEPVIPESLESMETKAVKAAVDSAIKSGQTAKK